jgi:hypothetical protein
MLINKQSFRVLLLVAKELTLTAILNATKQRYYTNLVDKKYKEAVEGGQRVFKMSEK